MNDENHWSELDNRGDYISGEVGDDGRDIAVGKNIDTRRSDNRRSNEVTVNLSTREEYRRAPHESHDEWQRRISVELEREFRKNFSDLTDALNKLQYTVALNNDLTNRQVKLLEQQVADTREIARKAETAVMTNLSGMRIVPIAKERPQIPLWLIYGIAVMLLAIVGMGIWSMVMLTMGGA